MKKYIAPEMEIFNIKIESTLLAGSSLTPEDWGGGGEAGSPMMLEDDTMNFLMGGGDYSDLEKLLGM